MKQVNIYSDGACSGNPGPGGYGTVLEYNGVTKEFSEGFADTTNNRMELLGAIVGLEALKEPCEVTLYSDSRYLCESVNQRWVYGWQARGWKKADKKPALNADLWETLLNLVEQHQMTYVWVKGHEGHPFNERCDRMAVSAAEKFKK